eukprot:366221-Chlamydomonas_euryale.AAC.10
MWRSEGCGAGEGVDIGRYGDRGMKAPGGPGWMGRSGHATRTVENGLSTPTQRRIPRKSGHTIRSPVTHLLFMLHTTTRPHLEPNVVRRDRQLHDFAAAAAHVQAGRGIRVGNLHTSTHVHRAAQACRVFARARLRSLLRGMADDFVWVVDCGIEKH